MGGIFNECALKWVSYYLQQHKDNEIPLFVTKRNTRLSREMLVDSSNAMLRNQVLIRE